MPAAINQHTRVLAIDDAPFVKRRGARVLVVGVLSRGARHVEGVFSTRVVRDGWGATAALSAMVAEHALAEQARYVLTDGVAVGGFNVIDLPALAAATGLGVIAVIRREPDMKGIERALTRVTAGKKRMATIQRAGPIHAAPHAAIWFQCAGCAPDDAAAVLAACTAEGNYPEPLRLAHLIGAGVVLGRSRGRP